MRVIIPARLSQTSEGQTGIESQTDEATRYADGKGWTVVATVADHKSGTVPPWKRPKLRAWVTEPGKLAQYDAVLAYRLDRLTRGDNASTNAIEDWAARNGKQLLTADGLVFPCEGNDGIRWDVAKRIAHQEWLEASERYRRMQRTLRAAGHWVGRYPYGFRLVPADDNPDHMKIEVEPEQAKVIRESAERYLSGWTLQAIADDLNARGIPCPDQRHDKPGSGLWHARTISKILRHPGIHGRLQNGPGHVVEVEPIISLADFRSIDARMAGRAHRRGVPPKDSALLTSVVFCGKCGRPMYRINGGYGKSRGAYYYCRPIKSTPSCKNMVKVEGLDDKVGGIILLFEDRPYKATVSIPADSHQDQIDQTVADIRALDPLADDYDTELAKLRGKLAELRSLPETPAHVKTIETGETIGEHWADLETDAERRQMLIDAGTKLYVIHEGTKTQIKFEGGLLGPVEDEEMPATA
jgi:site-specific DNA recombinase